MLSRYILMCFLMSSAAEARTLNHDLRRQIDQDPNRVLPQGELWSVRIVL